MWKEKYGNDFSMKAIPENLPVFCQRMVRKKCIVAK
jgi:hypothetical protein